jgi:hypothetical protein
MLQRCHSVIDSFKLIISLGSHEGANRFLRNGLIFIPVRSAKGFLDYWVAILESFSSLVENHFFIFIWRLIGNCFKNFINVIIFLVNINLGLAIVDRFHVNR